MHYSIKLLETMKGKNNDTHNPQTKGKYLNINFYDTDYLSSHMCRWVKLLMTHKIHQFSSIAWNDIKYTLKNF